VVGNEQRLWLVVLLEGLADLRKPDRSKWVGSRGFKNISQAAGVSPAIAALLTARQAKSALRILRSHQNLDKVLDQLEGEDRDG
jgi:hypothetical protein